MTRQEHLQWAKNRALEYADAGDAAEALASMTSDLREHPELENHIGIQLGLMLALGGHMHSASEVRNWIEGFN